MAARRLIIALLVAAGLFAMFRSASVRRSSEEPGTVALTNRAPVQGPESSSAGLPGLIGVPGQVEVRSPTRVQLLGPSASRIGERPFHIGVGLSTAAFALAVLCILGVRGSAPSKVIGLVCLAPAAWALWKMGSQAGPSSATAEAGSEALAAGAPVFAVSMLLGLAFSARRR